ANAYGLYIDGQSNAANNFALYSAAGTNFFGGNIGLGTSTPDALTEILGTTQQLRLTHTDDTYYAGFTVDGTGKLTISTQAGLELTGGTLTATDFSCTDCIDYSELADNMTLDADWNVNMGSYDIN